MEDTQYWIFYCNPQFYSIDNFLDSGEIKLTWGTHDSQRELFNIGDKGIIRVGLDGRTKKQLNGKQKLESGIYAIVQIISTPDYIPDSDSENWLIHKKTEENELRVWIKILKNLLVSPILINDLKSIQETKQDKALIEGRQLKSFPLSKLAFNKIDEITISKLAEIENIENENCTNLNELRILELKYSNATPKVKEIISRKIERGAISRFVKKINNYECQVCKGLGLNPYGFIKLNGERFIETHHIIPVSEMEQGSLGVLNLITVCPNHHRQMHYGQVKLLENNNDLFRFTIDGKILKINKITSC